jgi:rhamnogalacturonyl hydrolase YesR
MFSLIPILLHAATAALAAQPAPLDVLRATIASMLRQTPRNSTFFQYNYGPGYAFAAVYEAARLRGDLNFTAAVSAYLDLYLQPGGYAFNITHGVRMPFTGAVGEPTSFAVAYAARARDPLDWAVATQTADTYMLGYPYRLADGTFVRPGGWGAQPGHAFLWGDDQFMALALLCRLARARAPRAPEYLAVAVANALTNAARAQQPSGLFPHGFNTLTNESSCCAWGRANGWVAMSLVELLWALPTGAPERPAVLGVFSRLAEGLARAQDPEGRWHQVLDDSATFLETSASAMFTFALATGAAEGWLPRARYEAPVRAAWAGLLRAVRDDGSVEGVCEGTPVELTVAAYQSRTTFYNMSDPGLGAVFRATMAVERFLGGAQGASAGGAPAAWEGGGGGSGPGAAGPQAPKAPGGQAAALLPVWPAPRGPVTAGNATVRISPSLAVSGAAQWPDVAAGVERFLARAFPHPAPPAASRRGPPSISALALTVANGSAALQLGVDESCAFCAPPPPKT